jgi:hypothetical protein
MHIPAIDNPSKQSLPMSCFLVMELKKKKCCKEYKKGDQCRKCPKLKALPVLH